MAKQKQEQGKAVSRPAGQRYCPKCRSEYQAWVKFCIDCGAELTDRLPSVPEHSTRSFTVTNQEPELVIVCTVGSELATNVIKSHLEIEGIPVIVQGETYGRMRGFTVGGLGQVNVLVPKEFAETARQIIKAKESGEVDVLGTFCSQCGAAIANKTDSFCDKCGAKVPTAEVTHQKNVALNCPKCGTIMIFKDKHQTRKNFISYISSWGYLVSPLGCLLAPIAFFLPKKDYYICPECGTKTAVPED